MRERHFLFGWYSISHIPYYRISDIVASSLSCRIEHQTGYGLWVSVNPNIRLSGIHGNVYLMCVILVGFVDDRLWD